MKLNTEKIRSLAFRRDKTQSVIASETGISRTTITLIFNGKSCCYETGCKIAEALGVDLDVIRAKD